jgi:hypothetical protein
MKTLLLFALACPGLGLLAQESWVRQTDLTSGLIYDLPLGPNGGDFTAALPVSEQGSLFELFARGTAWDSNIYRLDSKLIRAYSPAITVALAVPIRGTIITLMALVAGGKWRANENQMICAKP